MLTALVSAHRGQSLHMLDISCTKVTASSYEFPLPEHVRQSRPGFKTPSVLLKAYPVDKTLCVFQHLTEHLKRTKPLRGAETKLFVSFVKPHKSHVWQEKQYQGGFERLWKGQVLALQALNQARHSNGCYSEG